jgi:CO/xanthine dehydrogenase Mo-binding subunit
MYWNLIISQVVSNEAVGIDIVDVEAVIDDRACMTSIIGDYASFFTVGIDGSISNISY